MTTSFFPLPPLGRRRSPRLLTPIQKRIRDLRINAALWTFQGWLAMFFVAAGFAKVSEPTKYLDVLLGWSAHVPEALVRGVGVLEMVAAATMLAPLAGWRIGRPVVRIGAALLLASTLTFVAVHLVRIELVPALVSGVLAPLAAFVLKGRRNNPAVSSTQSPNR